VALAQITSTLIVDCDLRAPAMHKVFNTPNSMGLVDVLIEGRDLREVYHEPFPGLKMITAGPMFPSPTEFLSSERFAQFVDRAREQFEYVLMDSSPIHLTSDALIVARHCDGVLVVLDAENTRKVSLRQSVRSLESVGAKVLGTVMHNAKVSTSFDTAR
jgi:receptor protein-tyrosine kinase